MNLDPLDKIILVFLATGPIIGQLIGLWNIWAGICICLCWLGTIGWLFVGGLHRSERSYHGQQEPGIYEHQEQTARFGFYAASFDC